MPDDILQPEVADGERKSACKPRRRVRWLAILMLLAGNACGLAIIQSIDWSTVVVLRYDEPIAPLGFAADGKTLVTSSCLIVDEGRSRRSYRMARRGKVQLWNLANGSMRTIVVDANDISPKATTNDIDLIEHTIATDKVHLLQGALTLSPDGATLLYYSTKGIGDKSLRKLLILDLLGERELYRASHDGYVSGQFSPSGQYVLLTLYDKTDAVPSFQVVRLSSGSSKSIDGHAYNNLRFLDDDSGIVAGVRPIEKMVTKEKTQSLVILRLPDLLPSPTKTVAARPYSFSRNGKIFALRYDTGIELYDFETCRKLSELKSNHFIGDVIFSNDDRYLIASHSGNPLRDDNQNHPFVHSFSSGGRSKCVSVWSLDPSSNFEPVDPFKNWEFVQRGFSPNSDGLFRVPGVHPLDWRLQDVEGGRKSESFPHQANLLAMSADGARIVVVRPEYTWKWHFISWAYRLGLSRSVSLASLVGSPKEQVDVVDTFDGTVQKRFVVGFGESLPFELSPDGNYFAMIDALDPKRINVSYLGQNRSRRLAANAALGLANLILVAWYFRRRRLGSQLQTPLQELPLGL